MKIKPRLSIEERYFIEKSLKNSKPIIFIVTKLKRSKSCIYNEINKNGGVYSYDPLKGQNNSSMIRKDIKISYMQRIEYIEFQLEILVDAIKDLTKKINE